MTFQLRKLRVNIVRAGLLLGLVAATFAAEPAGSLAPISSSNSEIAELKAMLLEQQRQINELRTELAQQKATVASLTPSAPEPSAPAKAEEPVVLASTTPILPSSAVTAQATSTLSVAPQVPAAAANAGPSVTDVARRVDGLVRNVAGFRFSGDFRYRFDVQDRSANDTAAALQNIRSRYRLRLNIDKDLFNRDGDSNPLARAHIQLSTAPFNNELTNDTDFNSFGTKAPFSIAEAFVDLLPTRRLTFRVGRMQEVFADNRQFIWDDDIRFNGFQETYRLARKNSLFVDFRAAQYILTNPNVQIVPAGSPYLDAGYQLGRHVPASDLYDQGIVVGKNINEQWRTDVKVAYFAIRNPNQIQLASTPAGQGILTNGVLGATMSSTLGAVGNATTKPGGAIYTSEGFNVVHYGLNLNYSGHTWMGHNFPFALFLQGTHNTSASDYNNGYMLGASIGQAARLGDVQFQYAYMYKPANAFVSQFTDDDVGNGSGVNIKDHAIRVNFGITRWLMWENRIFLQNGIARSDPARNFFVPLQQGYNTTIRYQSHLSFTF